MDGSGRDTLLEESWGIDIEVIGMKVELGIGNWELGIGNRKWEVEVPVPLVAWPGLDEAEAVRA